MKILHTADWHLGKTLEGRSRLEEQRQFLEDLINKVEEEQVNLILIAGDVYDTPNPPAQAETLFYQTLSRLSNEGQRLIIVIAGNHDSPDRLAAVNPLGREHGLIIVGVPRTIIEVGTYGKNKVVASGEGYIEVEINKEKAVILTLPYPNEKRLNEVLYGNMESAEDKGKTYEERVGQLFKELSKQYREDTINLAISHLFVMGSEESGSESGAQLGGSYIVNGSYLPREAQYIALGHIHKPQVVPGTHKKARYSGSPLHYNKREIGYTKQYLMIEVSKGEEAKITAIDIPTYKPIEIWRCKTIEEAIAKCEQNQHKACYVYLEIETDRYIREDELKEMKQYKEDIIEVVPILLQEKEDERELEALMERDFKDIFKAFYKKERKTEVTEEVLGALLELMEEETVDETHSINN